MKKLVERRSIAALAIPAAILALWAGLAAGQEETRSAPAFEKDDLLALIQSAARETPRGVSLTEGFSSERAPLEMKGVARAIRQTRLSVDFTASSVKDVLDYLRTVTRLNFVVSAKAQAALAEEQPKIRLSLASHPLEDILELVTAQIGDYRFTLRSRAIVLVRLEEYRPVTVLRIYNVSDLLRPRPDFKAPALGASLTREEE
jgi:hypothetical protein